MPSTVCTRPRSSSRSRNVDAYPEVGGDLTLGPEANPAKLVQSLEMASRLLAVVVNDAEPDARAIIFRRPEPLTGVPADFVPRAATELILHAHDVGQGLGVPFEPPVGLCYRLREHTRVADVDHGVERSRKQ